MRTFVTVLVIVAVVYLLVVIVVWRWQERIVWQPPSMILEADSVARRVDYQSEDGQPLYAYLVGNPREAPGLLIAFHGNADLAARLVPWAAEVRERTGWAVLLPEYRGYGGLAGTPDYPASRRDALATHRLARETLGADAARIAIYGHSLGSAVASELATDHPPLALLLVSPFTSARDMAGNFRPMPISPMWRFIGRVHFDTRAKVAALDAPVWVAHGERDVIIPVRMGKAVHAAARVPGELLLVPGAGHNDVDEVAGERYWDWLARALSSGAVSPTRAGAS